MEFVWNVWKRVGKLVWQLLKYVEKCVTYWTFKYCFGTVSRIGCQLVVLEIFSHIGCQFVLFWKCVRILDVKFVSKQFSDIECRVLLFQTVSTYWMSRFVFETVFRYWMFLEPLWFPRPHLKCPLTVCVCSCVSTLWNPMTDP